MSFEVINNRSTVEIKEIDKTLKIVMENYEMITKVLVRGLWSFYMIDEFKCDLL